MAKVPNEGQTMVEVTLRLPVSGEMLHQHVPTAEQKGGPYSADPDEWDGSDVFRLHDLDIVDPGEVELVNVSVGETTPDA